MPVESIHRMYRHEFMFLLAVASGILLGVVTRSDPLEFIDLILMPR